VRRVTVIYSGGDLSRGQFLSSREHNRDDVYRRYPSAVFPAGSHTARGTPLLLLLLLF
jgi:hypothetical protein